MANQETRILSEGSLRWVQAGSGTGATVTTGWITASAAATGLFGFVRAGMAFAQQQNYQDVKDRGIVKYFKLIDQNVGTLSLKLGYGVTADYPPTAATASGFSTQQIHLQWKADTREVGGGWTGLYYLFTNCVNMGPRVTEGDNEDTMDFDFRFVTMVGPTASGYL